MIFYNVKFVIPTKFYLKVKIPKMNAYQPVPTNFIPIQKQKNASNVMKYFLKFNKSYFLRIV